MSETNLHLSVIVPVYNSAGFLARSLYILDDFLNSLACSAELILVDDGSSDHSPNIIGEWVSGKRSYSAGAFYLKDNLGKGSAVAKGMLEAKGRFRVFLDADLAYAPSQVLRILEALEEGADVAVACRVHENSRYTISPGFFHYLYTRHVASRLINLFLRKTAIPNCRDSQAGLKGFCAKAAEEIFSRQTIAGFSFDVEALFLARKLGFKTREVPVDYHYFDEPTTVVFFKDGLGMLKDVLKIQLNNLMGKYKTI